MDDASGVATVLDIAHRMHREVLSFSPAANTLFSGHSGNGMSKLKSATMLPLGTVGCRAK